MSAWYHCKGRTFSFNSIPKSSSYSYFFEMWPFVYKTVSGFSGSVILRNRPLKFPFRIVLIWQFAENAPFFWRKISQKLHGGDENHSSIFKKISKSTDELFFTLCQLQLSISQNRLVQLVPCFVEVHHICDMIQGNESHVINIDFELPAKRGIKLLRLHCLCISATRALFHKS